MSGVLLTRRAFVGGAAAAVLGIPLGLAVVARRERRPRARVSATALDRRLRAFGLRVRAQWPRLLRRYSLPTAEGILYASDGHRTTIRSFTYAVELAACFDALADVPDREGLVRRLRSFQDEKTGLCRDPWEPPDRVEAYPREMDDNRALNHILAVGYALELLGARYAHPVRAADRIGPDRLREILAALPWNTRAWGAGTWVDGYATALYFNARHFGMSRSVDPLFHWLDAIADPRTGRWGRPGTDGTWRQPVNGFYRLTRGSYAQWGKPVPFPEAALKCLLAHSRDARVFGADQGSACDVLDVAHPIWLCRKQIRLPLEPIQGWARVQIQRVLDAWVDDQGCSFGLGKAGPGPSRGPNLIWTVVWLAALYYLADLFDSSEALGFTPAKIYRASAREAPPHGEPGSRGRSR